MTSCRHLFQKKRKKGSDEEEEERKENRQLPAVAVAVLSQSRMMKLIANANDEAGDGFLLLVHIVTFQSLCLLSALQMLTSKPPMRSPFLPTWPSFSSTPKTCRHPTTTCRSEVKLPFLKEKRKKKHLSFFVCPALFCPPTSLLKTFSFTFRADCFTLFLPAVPEQLFPLAPPPSSSPVSFSAHFSPAVAVSPLRQVPVLEGKK